MDPILQAQQRAFDMRLAAHTSGPRVPMPGGVHKFSVDPTSVHVNQPLANMSIKYTNREMEADAVSPVIPVKKRSDVYFKYGTSMGFDLAKTDVSSQSGSPGQASPSYSTDSYSVTDHALRDYVPQGVIENADAPLTPMMDSAEYIHDILVLARENRVATAVGTSGNYGSNTQSLSGANRWDVSTGTPISLFENTIRPAMTMLPMIGIIGEQVWGPMRNNPEVKSFITGRPSTAEGATPFQMDDKTMARAFGLRRFIIGGAKYNSAPEGEAASIASSFIWGKFAAFLHVPESPGIKKASFGYTFRFGPFETRSWFQPELGVRGSHVVQVDHADSEKIIDTTGLTGYLVLTCVS